MAKEKNRIEALASQILVHKKLYYSGKSIISDAEFDALEDELKKIAPHHPVLSMVGYPLAESQKKVKHQPPMLSLNKTYSVEDLEEFLKKNVCVMSDKFDGMALSIEYDEHGVLKTASTRGSGTLGEDVTEHIFHVPDIPKQLRLKFRKPGLRLEMRGEVYFPISEFHRFENEFDSYRNAVPGTFGRKEIDLAAPVLRVLKFCAYDAVIKDEKSEVVPFRDCVAADGFDAESCFERLKYFESLGFHTGVAAGTTLRLDSAQVEQTADLVAERFVKKRDYQMDGIVFRIDSDPLWEELGVTSHHPRGSIAFKQTGDVAFTKILEIEESVGRSGKITFRARLEPVQLSGAKINYATLHNAEFIESGNYSVGATVKVTRSGEVIPSIIGLETAGPEKFRLPEKCPCGYAVLRTGPDLYCNEKKACARKDQESLVYFVHTLGIMGISDKIIMRLREAGLIQEPADLYRLQAKDLTELEGFAEKSAENAIDAIQSKREIPLALFLAALGLKRGGIVKCQDVARRFKTLDAVRKATAEDMMAEKGWAEKSAEDFFNSLSDKSEAVDRLIKYVKVLPDDTPAVSGANPDHPLFGKTLCITGTLSHPRDQYKKQLEKIGARVSDSVNSKTDWLVCNEASSSKKYKQAKELGVEVISEQQLMQMLAPG